MAEKNYYEILGVDRKATDDEIKKAYRALAKKYHPDLHPGDKEAEAKLKEVNEANEVLSDPQKRAAYDYELEHPGASAGGGTGFSGSGFSGFGDIFSEFFSGFGGGGRAESSAEPGEDVQMEVSLSFLDAAKGCSKKIKYARRAPCQSCRGTGARGGTAYKTCEKCNGSGQVRYKQETMFGTTIRVAACDSCGGIGRKITDPCPGCKGRGFIQGETEITLNIPAGADTNSYIRKKGYGHASRKGGDPGDLIVVFRVEPHKLFKRKDRDLFIEVPISYSMAVCGGKIRVPSIDETFEYAIPEGTQSGTVFVVRGKGIKTRTGTGNMHITVQVEVPQKPTREQKQRIEAADGLFDMSKQREKMRSFSNQVKSLYGEDPYGKK